MDGEPEPIPAEAEEAAGERVEPMDATPSPEPAAAPASEEEAGEAVSMEEEEEEAGEEKGDDDDVVLVGEEDPEPSAAAADLLEPAETADMVTTTSPPASPASSRPSPVAVAVAKPPEAEPIIIDDEEEEEEEEEEDASSSSPPHAGGGSSESRSPGALSAAEPDSEIRIASVTGRDGGAASAAGSPPDTPPPADVQEDMTLVITSVTSLQGGAAAVTVEGDGLVEENGLQIGSAFSLNPDAPAGRPPASFNPGRGSGPAGQLVPNGDAGTHARADSWISQSASVPRNQKQTGVDSPSPASSLPKPPGQSSSSTSSSGSQPRTVKVTCANCKKPLKKGQTAYQRKGSTHLFCSTTCLSAFSHKPAPKKSCTMCKKDITNMKGTIVAQVDSSESFQEFCSTGCLGAYENKQNPPKSGIKTKCTVCGKLTEAHSKLATCLTCKTLIKTGEVLHSLGAAGTMGSFCTVNCMNKGKLATTSFINSEPSCHFCKRNSLPQYQATLPEGNVLNFCSSQCVTKFQNAALQTTTNGQTALSTSNNAAAVQLKCNYCRGTFSLKPETLEWEDKVYQFCSRTCCEDYKKLHCIVTFCEYCQEEKTLHETVKFSGVKKPFCSEGCKLLFKQDFIRRLGLKCVSCNHCSQLCRRSLTRQLGGMTRDFCSESCAKRFNDWYFKALRCDCCRVQGNLTESVMWRAEMKHFCDQNCLLKFYCQQNQPIMVTQRGPENAVHGYEMHGAKLGMVSQGTAPYGGLMRDVKNKAVLCKPLTLTKATYCKPHMQSKLLQTDVDDGVKREYIPVPIPVPVFIPVPMSMYSQITPLPLALPVPIPVPAFLPTTLQGAEQILQVITELRNKESADPAEAELLAEAERMEEDGTPGGGEEEEDVKLVTVKTESRVEEASTCNSEEEEKLQEERPAEEEEELEEETLKVEGQEEKPAEEEEKPAEEEEKPAEEEEKPAEEEEKPAEEEEKPAEEEEIQEEKPAEEEKQEKKEEEETPKEETPEEKEEEKQKEGEEEEETPKQEEEEYEPDLDLEADFPQASDPVPVLEGMDEDLGFSLPPVLNEEAEEAGPRPHARRQGHKRRALEDGSDQAPPTSSRPADRRSGGRSLPLKARYGVNAWRRWALAPPDQSEDAKVKPARSHSNLLALSAEELSAALSRFVREVCRPGGERYSPDSILYLCLGIQQHLHSKGRTDDLFSDPSYRQFGEELDKVLKDWQPSVLPDGSLWGRVEERSLWSSRQLGQQSPAALLRSLVYLNTKYFGLRTAEQHLRLSFSNVFGPDAAHPAGEESAVCIRVPSISQEHHVQTEARKRKRPLEDGDSGGPAVRCPVQKHECRLYDLYRSKCPALLRERLDVFYVQPVPACGPDDPLWFSSTPLERRLLDSLLTRVLLVRDVYTDTQRRDEEDEEEEGGGGEEPTL
ncbi:zinc finger MYM-type protein 2 isoform X2 [Clinocottus analis]|uniref:zinc finger MYM-type protein 2 isoform X2 n=1 Tax=Clinocottus analis TaxID=304258 RepID=UPI0035BEC66A